MEESKAAAQGNLICRQGRWQVAKEKKVGWVHWVPPAYIVGWVRRIKTCASFDSRYRVLGTWHLTPSSPYPVRGPGITAGTEYLDVLRVGFLDK